MPERKNLPKPKKTYLDLHQLMRRPKMTPGVKLEHFRNLVADLDYAAHELTFYDPRLGLLLSTMTQSIEENDFDLLFSFFLAYLKKKSEIT